MKNSIPRCQILGGTYVTHDIKISKRVGFDGEIEMARLDSSSYKKDTYTLLLLIRGCPVGGDPPTH